MAAANKGLAAKKFKPVTRMWSIGIWMLAMLVSLAGASFAATSMPSPQIFFSDLDSGPNAGGEAVSGFSGAYVTLYGNFFGTTPGTVTWNGLNCLRIVGPVGSYQGWGSTYFWYQRIIVQLGPACTAGTGNFVVTANGKSSNGIPFTVRSGNIFFVATTGKAGNNGSFANPFATIPQCRNALHAGDICYIENGVVASTVDNFDATLSVESGGSAGNPIAFVGYPGSKATFGSSSITYGIRVPNISVSPNFVTVAGLYFNLSEQAMNPTNSNNWRIVGNNFQCPTANGQTGCFETNEMSLVKFFGNETTNVGPVAAGKQQHADYLSSDTNHVEFAWNYIHDNHSCRALQVHSSPLGGGGPSDPSGHNQFDLSIHDNLIHDDPCDGINLATVDPSQGKVEVYNNVIYHVGIGPDPADGESGDYSCIRVVGLTNTGPAGGGTVEVYNNTLYDCGSHIGTFNASGAFELDGANPNLFTNLRDNVVYQTSGEFWANGGKAAATMTGSNNIWSGSNQALPTQTTGNIHADPLFFSLASNDFHLLQSSPAVDAGVVVSASNSYKNFQVWNGNPTDRDGGMRPQGTAYDIGAYEFSSGGGVRPNPPTNLVATVQ